MQPLLLIGSAAGIGLGAFGAWKAAQIRPELDALRVVVCFAVIAAMSYLTGVPTSRTLMFGALVLGLLVGITQVLRHPAFGIAIWGAGLLVAQIAAAADRASTFKAGQAISYFAVALTIGMHLGRRNKMRAGMGRYAASGAATVAVLFVVCGMPLAALAQGRPTDELAPPIKGGLNQSEPIGDETGDATSGAAPRSEEIPSDRADTANAAGTVGAAIIGALGVAQLLGARKNRTEPNALASADASAAISSADDAGRAGSFPEGTAHRSDGDGFAQR